MCSKRFIMVFLLTAVLFLQNTLAKDDSAKPARFGRAEKFIEIKKEIVDRDLNLTDEQEKAFKKIDLAFQKETIALRNDLQVKQLELQSELSEDKPDIKKIESLIDEIAKLRASVQKKRLSAYLQKRSLLDAEQRKIFDRRCPWGEPFGKMRMRLGRGKGPWLFHWFEEDDED